MEEFVYLIRPTRENFIESMTQKEKEIMDNHFEYLAGLLSEKKLILAGPCLDGAFGIVVIQAESMETARNIMKNDPSIHEGIMSSELHPYRVSLLQTR
ncbi:YciI family protein [Alicyclobacillus fastidiosus]|uniref:YciI family protein n=1 Tax=Alicyclobacillus fastidiosus TaxID=392011 RepID=A0ABV5AJL8_9BACL|nr:YciI family protein [Alicyclobacillus fastidiosus]WEH08240.1 YciI family protein [Alicyclobacillus fastidiosus]